MKRNYVFLFLYIFFSLRVYAADVLFTFDFKALKDDDTEVHIFLFNQEILTVNAGENVPKKLEHRKEYLFYFEYRSKNPTKYAESIPLRALPLYIPYNEERRTIKIPIPSRSPSGLAKIQLKNNFNNDIRVYAYSNDTQVYGHISRKGYIAEFDPYLSREKQNSVLSKRGEWGDALDFTIPANTYKLEVRDTNGDILRNYDEFYFPASFSRYTIILDPYGDGEAKIEHIHAKNNGKRAPENTINLEQEFEVLFSKPMLKEITANNLNFYDEFHNKDTQKIPAQLEWNSNGTTLFIKPIGFLSPKMNYFISFNRESRDIYGSRLAESKEFPFCTNDEHPAIPQIGGIPDPDYDNLDHIITFQWAIPDGADGCELRIYDKYYREILNKNKEKELSHTFPCRDYLKHEYLIYRIIPYKYIDGKKAYSLGYLDNEGKKFYFSKDSNLSRTFYVNIPQSDDSDLTKTDLEKISGKVTKYMQENGFKLNSNSPEYYVDIIADINLEKEGDAPEILFFINPYISVTIRNQKSDFEKKYVPSGAVRRKKKYYTEGKALETAFEYINNFLDNELPNFIKDSQF